SEYVYLEATVTAYHLIIKKALIQFKLQDGFFHPFPKAETSNSAYGIILNSQVIPQIFRRRAVVNLIPGFYPFDIIRQNTETFRVAYLEMNGGIRGQYRSYSPQFLARRVDAVGKSKN